MRSPCFHWTSPFLLLHYFCLNCPDVYATMILAHGASLQGSSPIQFASSYGHADVVKLFLEAGAEVERSSYVRCTHLFIEGMVELLCWMSFLPLDCCSPAITYTKCLRRCTFFCVLPVIDENVYYSSVQIHVNLSHTRTITCALNRCTNPHFSKHRSKVILLLWKFFWKQAPT